MHRHADHHLVDLKRSREVEREHAEHHVDDRTSARLGDPPEPIVLRALDRQIHLAVGKRRGACGRLARARRKQRRRKRRKFVLPELRVALVTGRLGILAVVVERIEIGGRRLDARHVRARTAVIEIDDHPADHRHALTVRNQMMAAIHPVRARRALAYDAEIAQQSVERERRIERRSHVSPRAVVRVRGAGKIDMRNLQLHVGQDTLPHRTAFAHQHRAQGIVRIDDFVDDRRQQRLVERAVDSKNRAEDVTRQIRIEHLIEPDAVLAGRQRKDAFGRGARNGIDIVADRNFRRIEHVSHDAILLSRVHVFTNDSNAPQRKANVIRRYHRMKRPRTHAQRCACSHARLSPRSIARQPAFDGVPHRPRRAGGSRSRPAAKLLSPIHAGAFDEANRRRAVRRADHVTATPLRSKSRASSCV
nr:non-ribosomal peptide synthetase domain protein [Burkholderia pseudomallei MSHR4868]